jgi:hypothetical protein
MDKSSVLRVSYLEQDYGSSRMAHTMKLLNVWLQGSDFKADYFHFTKINPEAKWSDMLKIIESKIFEYANDTPVITLVLSSSGRITREINGLVLTHDFTAEKLKSQILAWLPDDGSYLKTERLKSFVGSKSAMSVSKMIGAINTVTTSKLQLPKQHPLIESKRISGYRINPIYNLVRVK